MSFCPSRRSQLGLIPHHHVAYLQGHVYLSDLHSVKPNLSKEERNQFKLQDLTVDLLLSPMCSWYPLHNSSTSALSPLTPARLLWISSRLTFSDQPLAGRWSMVGHHLICPLACLFLAVPTTQHRLIGCPHVQVWPVVQQHVA